MQLCYPRVRVESFPLNPVHVSKGFLLCDFIEVATVKVELNMA